MISQFWRLGPFVLAGVLAALAIAWHRQDRDPWALILVGFVAIIAGIFAWFHSWEGK